MPIVISSSGLAGSFFTSELSLTNRGTTTAAVRFTYNAAFGGGGGTATDTLPAGRQKTVPDAIAYLISLGAPIPSSGNRGGVLRVDFTGLSRADAGAATVRTTSVVSGGRAGLSYPAFAGGIGGTAFLCGLRQDATDRSNVALVNAGVAAAGDIVLRLTVFSGAPAAPVVRALPDLALAPGAFRQYTEILKDVGLDRGYVRVERVSGTAPYYAYATILDRTTSDGSFVPPLTEDDVYGASGSTLPVVVETSAFSTEIVLCNVSTAPQTVRLSYVADAVQAPDSTAAVSIVLLAGEQKVIPSFVQYLRDQAIPGVGGAGPTFAGALHLSGSETGGIFLGGRTQTSGSGGRYGLFYTAVAHGQTARSAAWLYGLQQNAENRTNLALVNTGEVDGSSIDLRLELYDGETGSMAGSKDVSLAPRKWTQINSVLSQAGIANGFARVTRTSGSNPFLAYAVVVDGGEPQARSDDGAFVSLQLEEPPPSAELAAMRKVEAKCRSLLAQGASPLEYVRAVGAFMATLPEYAVSGVDEPSLTAYGAFADGRLHLVTNNREFDNIPESLAAAQGRQSLAPTELPDAGWARVLQSFGQHRQIQEPVSDLEAWLKDPGGYAIRVGKVGDARLTALRAISGDGFFYLNAHGGRAWKTKDKSGPSSFSVQSSSLVTPGSELLPENRADLAAGRLTYFTAINFEEVFDVDRGEMVYDVDTRYGITGGFVKAYWRFAPHSIVFLNVCWSGHPAGARDFIDACLDAKAGVYFGWNKDINSGTCFKTVRYFVDRLIGANKFMKESPDQRAFPWELVYDDMQKHGLTHSQKTGADLVPFPGPGGGSVVLDPSIEYLIVDEVNETLELKGYFGGIKGKVMAGGKELSGCAWGKDAILCLLPATGAGSNGDVFAEVPSALGLVRKSNVRQLTEWSIPLRYSWKRVIHPEWKFEGNGRARFRADIGSYRKKPGEPPFYPARGMAATKDSLITVTGSGVYVHTGPGANCTETLAGSAAFESDSGGSVAHPLLWARALVDSETPHIAAIGLFMSAVPFPFRVTCAGSTCGEDCSSDLLATFGYLDGEIDFPSPLPNVPAVPWPGMLMTWDDRFGIPAKTFTTSHLGIGDEIKVEWPAVEPIPEVKVDLAR